jgi:hypothetical protein
MVLEEERDVVRAAQADVTEQEGEPVGAGLELCVRQDLAARLHDERRLVRVLLRVFPRVHAAGP